MDDDLDTPRAVALVFELVRRANALLDAGDPSGAAPLAAAVFDLTAALGLAIVGEGDDVPAEVADLARQRDAARAAKDWAAADALRDRLQADGWTIEDTPDGTKVRRA